MHVIILFLLTLNTFSLEANTIYIEDSILEEDAIEVKKEKSESTLEALENKSNTFIRKSGGIGSKYALYIDSSTESQVSLSIEGFDYTTPTLASFTPTLMHFGGLSRIDINKDDAFEQNNITSHTAGIHFSLPEKNYISTQFGSFYTFGLSGNQHIPLKSGSFNFGAVLLTSENNFPYLDFHNQERKRENAYYKGGDFYLKYTGKQIKFLHYFIMNEKGDPGSAQFERKAANSHHLQHLTGISYQKNIQAFTLSLKLSNNYKKYNYIDQAPPIIGLEKLQYRLTSNTTSSSLKTSYDFNDFHSLSLKLGNLFYLAESNNFGNQQNIPQINESHSFIEGKSEHLFLDDSLVLKAYGRSYFNKMFQYSFSGIYYINQHILIKLLTKKGLRIPYLEEKYWQSSSVIGNKNLSPETLYKHAVSLKVNLKHLQFDLEYFHAKLQNNIIFAPISFGLFKAINTDEASANGFHINLKLAFKYLQLSNFFSYNSTKYVDHSKYLPQVPKYQNKFTLLLKYQSYQFALHYNYTGQYYNNIFNTDVIPSKHLLNLSFGYQPLKRLNLQFKINNILNHKDYYDSIHIPLMGRSYFLYIHLNFS